nr:PREDICTED: alanine aminotransferase 2-like [Paralichthys olivaceus]
MSATRMQLLSPRNVRFLSRGRSDLLAGSSSGAQRAGGVPTPRVRSLTCPPLSPSYPGRALSSLSATRHGLPKEKMSENGVVSRAKVLTIDTMNPTVKKVEYAVRGPIVQRAVELERELSEVCSLCMDHTLFYICISTLYMEIQYVSSLHQSANISSTVQCSLCASLNFYFTATYFEPSRV